MAKGKKGPHAKSKAAKIRTLLAEGLSVKEIAAKLKLNPNYVATTKWHWQKAQVKAKPVKAKPRQGWDAFPVEVKPDPVNNPSHYTDGGIETIAFIEAKKLDYHVGNAVKYLSRAGKKDPAKEIEDLKKAVWYINRRIERLGVDK